MLGNRQLTRLILYSSLLTLLIIATTTGHDKSVLFVCLGNICRSPMAAAIFRHLLRINGTLDDWIVDSAGHGYFHVGDPMDPRAVKTLLCHGITDTKHKARQLIETDYFKYRHILALDEGDLQGLQFKAPKNGTIARLKLLGEYDPHGRASVHDPYYVGNSTMFEDCFRQCYRSCEGFLQSLTLTSPSLTNTTAL